MPEDMKVETAESLWNNFGRIAKVSASGDVLVLYTGNPDDPGSWLEFDRLRIRDGWVRSVNPFKS